MVFTLNGGPADGQRVEVGGKHADGRTVKFTHIHEGQKYLYVCPSDEDFESKDLFLSSFIEFPSSSADLDMRDIMRKKSGKHPVKIPKAEALELEQRYKEYKEWKNYSHDQWEHVRVKQKPTTKGNDLRSGWHPRPDHGPESPTQGKP